MEEVKKQILHEEWPRQLNLNVPLLSTRRSPTGLSSSLAHTAPTSMDATNMVPFSWERIPGEPKEMETDRGSSFDATPPPKLPPGRWQPIPTEEAIYSTIVGSGHAANHCCQGSGSLCDDHGGVSSGIDCEYRDGEQCCSYAIDIFSLGESTSGEDAEDNCRDGATEDRQSALGESNYNGCHSPNFMMQRFLPDAQAIAEASVMNKAPPLPSDASSNFSRAVRIKRSYDSPKGGCGLGLSSFFSWRMKHKPCSVKSPVCDTIIGPNHKQNS